MFFYSRYKIIFVQRCTSKITILDVDYSTAPRSHINQHNASVVFLLPKFTFIYLNYVSFSFKIKRSLIIKKIIFMIKSVNNQSHLVNSYTCYSSSYRQKSKIIL